MRRYVVRRCAEAIFTLLAVTVIVFLLARLTGDPLRFLLDEGTRPDDVARVRAEWGLDRPLWEQYVTYMGNIAAGNFGESLAHRGRYAGELVASRLPATLELGLFSVAVSLLVAIPLGVYSAVKRGTVVDRLARVLALFGQSVPTFWFGIVAIWLVAVMLGLVPTSGRRGFESLILPGLTMGLGAVAALTRLLRSSMLDVLDAEYVRLARIKGVPGWKITWKHCLRNAFLGPMTYIGVIVAAAITGSIVVETVFSWPGIGQLSVQAVRARDFPVVQTVVLFFATAHVVITLTVDLLYGWLDPRVRLR